ncbi:MAG: hypothetical protein NC181_04865 [Clostridium sp.]|nr:hypothetical protein [Clostridium sp.]MCM1444572.1 hypothetical protein [Candidatus Amulumruptor caecigallinarius]
MENKGLEETLSLYKQELENKLQSYQKTVNQYQKLDDLYNIKSFDKSDKSVIFYWLSYTLQNIIDIEKRLIPFILIENENNLLKEMKFFSDYGLGLMDIENYTEHYKTFVDKFIILNNDFKKYLFSKNEEEKEMFDINVVEVDMRDLSEYDPMGYVGKDCIIEKYENIFNEHKLMLIKDICSQLDIPYEEQNKKVNK